MIRLLNNKMEFVTHGSYIFCNSCGSLHTYTRGIPYENEKTECRNCGHIEKTFNWAWSLMEVIRKKYGLCCEFAPMNCKDFGKCNVKEKCESKDYYLFRPKEF